MAVQPLSSANDRWFGRPLPCQLSNHTRAHRTAINLWHQSHATSMCYAVLAQVSLCYPPLYGRLLTRYSPVRHWSGTEVPSPFDLNVLCTPPAFILSQDQTLEKWYFLRRNAWNLYRANLISLCFTFCLSSILSEIHKICIAHTMLCTFLLLFNFQGSMCRPFWRQLAHYTTLPPSCQEPFLLFLNFFGQICLPVAFRSVFAFTS